MNARIHCLRAALVAASITGFAAAAEPELEPLVLRFNA